MKFTGLEKAWLEELGFLDAVDSISRADLKALKVRAGAASARVKENFENLRKSGELQEFNQSYKAYRTSTQKPMSWNNYALAEQAKVIRSMAREQITRAGRGESVE